MREQFGIAPDGTPVHRYTLEGARGLRLRVLDWGAIVQELWVPDAAGRRANVVLGFSDLDGYLAGADHFFGAVVGRFANRIGGARFSLDGVEHRLSPNDGDHALHGGADGFHARRWIVDGAAQDEIRLSLVSPDGDQGFPGQLRAAVRYRVSETSVHIDYSATSDAATVVSLTQHSHFNLAGEGSGSVDSHTIQVRADRCTPTGPDLLPTGEIVDVAGTPLDLREPVPVGDVVRSGHPQIRRARGLDLNYVLEAPGAHDGVQPPAAMLADPSSGRVLWLHTDQPGLQVYSCNSMTGTHVGRSGRSYRQGDGMALEAQLFPDSPHHEGRPGWPTSRLEPGGVYRHHTSWRFGTTL